MHVRGGVGESERFGFRRWRLRLYVDAAEAGACLSAPPRGGRQTRAPEPERSALEAARRARGQVRRYCAANRLNRLGTLTYAGQGCHDPRQLRRDVGGFFRRMRGELGGEAFPYLWVPEWHPGGHGLHVHFAVGRYIKQSLIRDAWRRGIVHIKLLGDLPVGSGTLGERSTSGRGVPSGASRGYGSSGSANRAAIGNAHRGESQTELDAMHEGLRELEREREAKEKLRQLREKRKAGPPDPRAASVTAAVLADPETFDLMRRKLREVQVPAGDFGQTRTMTMADPILNPEHVALLYLVLHALQDRGEVTIRVNGTVGVWPSEFELPATPGLPACLAHLRRNGYFDVESNGNVRRVQYGPRTRRIATKWGIALQPTETPKEATTANA